MRAILGLDFLGFAKRRRFFVLRTLTVAVPLSLLILIGSQVRHRSADALGLVIFNVTMFPILALAIFITPAMLAHVIAEERRNNKLEVLRSAPLGSASIVLGKWLSRVLLIDMVIIAALPLAALALLFGGVSPAMFLRSTVIVFTTVIWVSAVSLHVSATAKDLGVAVRRAYVLVIALGIGLFVLMGLSGSRAIRSQELAEVVASLQPFTALGLVSTPVNRFMTFTPLGLDPTLFHVLAWGCFSAFFLWLSVRALAVDLRTRGESMPAVVVAPAAAAVKAEHGHRPRRGGRFSRKLTLLRRDPARWLEVTRTSILGTARLRTAILLLAILFLEAAFLYALAELKDDGNEAAPLHVAASIIALTLAFFSTASLGASSFHRDNEANTRDVLFASPLSNEALARAKINGVLAGSRLFWFFSMAHAFLGVVCGDIHLVSAIVYTVVAYVLIVALAGFSMWIGLTSSNTTRAAVKTIGAMIAHLFIIPTIGLSLLAAANGEESLAGLFLGHHPLFIAGYTLVAGAFDGLVFLVLYWLGYLALAWKLVFDLIPSRYADLREDRVRPARVRPRRPTPTPPRVVRNPEA